MKITHGLIRKLAEQFVMVATEVVNLSPIGRHAENLFKHFEVSRGKVTLIKVPNVDNIPVQDQDLWLDTAQICQEFFSTTAFGPQVHIGNNSYL